MVRDKDITCPFCGDDGYDLVGLKAHLEKNCEAYWNTETIQEERERLNSLRIDKIESNDDK